MLLVEALRFRPRDEVREKQGLLAGLADPALALALRSVHADVARAWTVAELARVAGMSRAVFVQRFARKVGMPPMQYLLEWRIAIAKDVLLRDRVPLAQRANASAIVPRALQHRVLASSGLLAQRLRARERGTRALRATWHSVNVANGSRLRERSSVFSTAFF